MEATLTKRTPLYNKHVEAGAKIVPFAGYDMPVSYTGINAEHEAVRTAVGMFDVSHMGEFIVKGPGALDLIQRVTSNDASKLFDGKVQYSCLPNTTGGIIDDLLVYRMSEEEYMEEYDDEFYFETEVKPALEDLRKSIGISVYCY